MTDARVAASHERDAALAVCRAPQVHGVDVPNSMEPAAFVVTQDDVRSGFGGLRLWSAHGRCGTKGYGVEISLLE
jgi:hypothetical protein